MTTARYLSCPIIEVIEHNNKSSSLLKIKKLDCHIESHVSISFIRLNITYYNNNDYNINGRFLLNTDNGRCIVSNCDITLNNNKTFTTAIIDPENINIKPDENLQILSKDNGKGNYNPSIFEMPFHSCPSKSDIVVSVLYIRDMDYINGNYQLLVPITIPDNLIIDHNNMNNLVSINVILYPGTIGCKWGSGSHPTTIKSGTDPNCIEFYYDPKKDVINADFSFYYHVWTDDIVGSCIVQNGKDDNSEGGFVLFLSPSKNNDNAARRRVVFLLDHSGSMSGDPMVQAKEALITALGDLTEYDEFAICAFDDGEIWYDGHHHDDHHEEYRGRDNEKRKEQISTPKLLQGNQNQVKEAIHWIRTIQPNGGTDILSSYSKSIGMLRGVQNITSKLNMVVLITDGCVSDELKICKYAESHAKKENNADIASCEDIRTFTFGIGPFCNTAFLRSLAAIGHGHSYSAISLQDLKSQMTQFMNKTLGPQLSGISMVINPGRHCKDLEICPRSIPDLSSGSPLTIVGTFKGSFPSDVMIHGTSDLKQITINVSCYSNKTIPVHNLVARQKIDQLIGKWWLAGNDRTKQKKYRTEAVALAIATSTPCAFTNSIAFESTGKPTTGHHQTSVVASSETLVARNKKPQLSKGAILIGTAAGAAIIFGSIAATSGNISISDVSSFVNNSGFSMDLFNSFQIDPPNLDGVFGNIDVGSFTNMFSNIPSPNITEIFSSIQAPIVGDYLPLPSNLPSVDSNSCCCFNCDASNIEAFTSCAFLNSCTQCTFLNSCTQCGDILSPILDIGSMIIGTCSECGSCVGGCLGACDVQQICNCLGGLGEVVGELNS